jgi:hypothetical protein
MAARRFSRILKMKGTASARDLDSVAAYTNP